MRGIFFDEQDARMVADKLRSYGYQATVARERLAGEDDDEGHPWAVLTDAPEVELELLIDQYDGWLDTEPDPGPDVLPPVAPPPPEPPNGPRRIKREP